jgi:hypothetical protein
VINYDITNWYWKSDDGSIFSSARSMIVPATDQDFVAWKKIPGHRETPWPRDDQGQQTDAALQEVLTPAGLWCDLKAYANYRQQQIAQGGFNVNVNTSGTSLRVSVDTSPVYAGYLQGAVQVAQLRLAANDTTPIDWIQDSGTVHLTPQQVLNMGLAVAALIQQSFTVLGQVLTAIESGTITTLEQVNFPDPAWPTNN